MSEEIPRFKYHPDPLATGSIEERPVDCACCKRTRSHVYVGPVYGERDLEESLCPWCIADGSAAKLGASFSDDLPLMEGEVGEDIIQEVCARTPGYTAWQQDEWLCHCEDACEFHGDATPEDLANASEDTRLAWQGLYGLTEDDWSRITKSYTPRGDQAFYKFVCRHCHAVRLGWDSA